MIEHSRIAEYILFKYTWTFAKKYHILGHQKWFSNSKTIETPWNVLTIQNEIKLELSGGKIFGKYVNGH